MIPHAQLFRDIFNASPVGIAVENLEGQPLFVNPALCSMLGFSEEELRSKHCVQFSPPEDAEKDWDLFQQLRTGSIDHYQIEKRYFRRNGSLMWGRLSISLLNSLPSPLVFAIVEDITEERTAEEARFRHSAIVESSDDAIVSKNLDGIITGWNAAARRIFGYTEAEAVGQHITILIPPELLDEEKKILDRLRAGDRIEHYEAIRVTKAGKRVDMSLSIFPIYDSSGRIVSISKIARDITDQKRHEEALKKSEEKFAKAFRESPMALTLTSAKDHRYLDVNATFERITGWRRDEVIGRTPFDISIWVNPAQRIEFVNRLLAKGAIRDFEVCYRCKDRTERVGLGSAELIEIGNEPCVLSVIADITERKRAEEALSVMTRKFIEAQEQERARIGRELHDDINQRLAMLAIELEQLQENPCEIRSRVEELRKQTTEISNDVQALSHELHASKLEYFGAVAGIKSWCKEFGERQGIQIEFKSSEVQTSVAPDIGLCLFRVLQEALHNASKHSGVRRIEVQLREDAGEIHLVVSDLGRGFDLETATQARGLGLTSMQERVRLINGIIEIQSKPMGGTTVHVRVPLRSEHSQGAAG